MKRLLVFLSIISPLFVVGQTLEFEEAELNRIVKSKMLTHAEIKTLVDDWRAFVAENEYPKLPVNESGEVVFVEIMDLPGISSLDAFDKIKEWLAINYGEISSVLHYEDRRRGKIIAKGFFEMGVKIDLKRLLGGKVEGAGYFRVNHTLIFTVINDKVKVELTGLEYEYQYHKSEIAAVAYNSQIMTSYTSDELYPIVRSAPETWRMKLNLLEATKIRVAGFSHAIKRYIMTDDRDF